MSNTRSSARLLRPWKEKRRNRMTFVSKMYLKYSFKVTVWCEMWTNVLACAGLCCTSCKHDYFPVFRSQQELYALDMTQGMVPKVTEKESSQQYWCIFPVRQDLAQSIIILSCTYRSDCFFRSSRGFASHRAVRITFSNPARATAHASYTVSRTGQMIHELMKKKKNSITPHPNKTNSFVVVRTAHINSLVEQSIITACNHAQLTGLFTKHWAYKMNDT